MWTPIPRLETTLDSKTFWTVLWTGFITAVIFAMVENSTWAQSQLAKNSGPANSSVVPGQGLGTPGAVPVGQTPVFWRGRFELAPPSIAVQSVQPVTEAATNLDATSYHGAFGTTGPEYQGQEAILYQ